MNQPKLILNFQLPNNQLLDPAGTSHSGGQHSTEEQLRRIITRHLLRPGRYD